MLDMNLTALVISIASGVVSSLLTIGIVEFARRARDAKNFGALAGTYAHYSVTGERLLDGITKVAFRGGNVLLTHGSSSEGIWDGRIVMSQDLIGVGSGIYQYSARTDCGTHHVQVGMDRRSWFVLVVNTSHGQNSTFPQIWRRME
jgi:hypothetical protein